MRFVATPCVGRFDPLPFPLVPTMTTPELRDAPVGIFVSGFGGLTGARSVIDQLPHESIV